MRCKIAWIDEDGNTTPDNNEAIGYVTRCVTNDLLAMPVCVARDAPIPICAEHAQRIPPLWRPPTERWRQVCGGANYASWWEFSVDEEKKR